MGKFRFLEYQVYKDAKELKLYIKKVLRKSNFKYEFTFKNQLDRALYSIILNIAEGCSRKTKKDFKRFLVISMGSVNESVACIDIARDSNMISEKEFDVFLKKMENIARQLNGLIKTLN